MLELTRWAFHQAGSNAAAFLGLILVILLSTSSLLMKTTLIVRHGMAQSSTALKASYRKKQIMLECLCLEMPSCFLAVLSYEPEFQENVT